MSIEKFGVHIKGKPAEFTRFQALNDPGKEMMNANNKFINTKKLKSDVVPFVESNFLEILIPSFLGAKVHEAPGGLIDVRPVFKNIYETAKINEIDIFSGEMEHAIRHLTYIKDNAPDDLYVNPSRVMAPLDYGVVLMGSEFYTSFYEEPELVLEFMQKLTDATIKTIIELKKVISQPLNETITPQGYIFDGIRLTGDSVVNMSPGMIVDMICPFYKQFKDVFSSVMLHYCTRPASSTHVIKALSEGGGVDFVDNNWHGIDSLIRKEDYEDTVHINACVSLESEAILTSKDVPFLHTNRKIVLSTSCETLDTGKRILEVMDS